jgi:4-phytase/acid phosphatase
MIDQQTVLRFAQLNVEAIAMNDAALADDLDEARFRAHLIREAAEEMGMTELLEVAEDVIVLLRPPGTEPLPGYGHAMLRLAKLLTP